MSSRSFCSKLARSPALLELLLLPLGRVERRGESRYLAFVDPLLGALERQQIGQLLDLPIETRERGVLPRHLAREEKLREHEYGKQEDDDEQHRRQSIDKSRPVVEAAL